MKKVFFALFAVVIAVGGSAFTNAKVSTGTIYGSTNDDYSKRTTTVYNNNLCEDTADKICAYEVTELGAPFVTQGNYSDLDMINFKSLGYVAELPGARSGIYLPQ